MAENVFRNPNPGPTVAMAKPMRYETRGDALAERLLDAAATPRQPESTSFAGAPRQDTALARAHQHMVSAADNFETAMSGIDRGSLTDEGLLAVVAGAAKRPTTAIAEAERAVQDLTRSTAERVESIRNELSPRGDLAAEMRAGRTWERFRRILDGAPPNRVIGVAHELVGEADPAELGVLAEELGPYLKSRQLPADWLAAALTDVSPELKQAAERAAKAVKAQQIVEANVRSLRKAMTAARQTGSWRKPPLINPAERHDPDS
jgi:hypothetical protein